MTHIMRPKFDLSIVLPAYNEGQEIQETLSHLDFFVKNDGFNYEILVIDDGSIDNTRKCANDYAQRNGHVRVVGYKKNMGKGYALRTGFAHVEGKEIVFVDSDSDIDLRQIKDHVDALKHGDIVIGSKWHPNSVVDMPFVRRFLSRGFNMLVRLLTGVCLQDTQTGLKAIRRSAFKEILPKLCVKRFAFDVELLLLAKLCNLKVIERPVKLKLNGLFSVREIATMLIDLLGIAYRLRIARWYQHVCTHQTENTICVQSPNH